ncbi:MULTISPECIES: DUF6777 domain-containing protein [unclassified Streptomyces]|uniref:DUF6777 domain-containing protein n=1 Tax=Streptomyces sp. NPDC127532 TaxID=3345399 RepID=UPI00362CAF76
MPAPRRLRRALLGALSVGVMFAAGCGDGGERTPQGAMGTAGAEEVLLQPAAAAGPGPFTGSTARPVAAPADTAAPNAAPTSGAPRKVRAVSGAAPGLYGATRSVAGCDVGRQIRLLTADRAKSRAFAGVAGIEAVQIPGYLKALTPVHLRADVQVTSHGYAAGTVTGFQSVLQAGTAVMVDSRGLPRVRCAGGNPLDRPVVAKGRVALRGERWAGYDPSRTVIVSPGAQVLTELTLVNLADNTWIERPMGDGGGRDKVPEVPPPFEPGDDIFPPSRGTGPTERSEPSGPASPAGPAVPAPPGDGGGGDAGRGATTPDVPTDTPTDLPPDAATGPVDPAGPMDPAEPPAPGDGPAPDGEAPDGGGPLFADEPAEPAAPEPFGG